MSCRYSWIQTQCMLLSHIQKRPVSENNKYSVLLHLGLVVSSGAFAESFNHAYMSSFSAVVFTAVPFLLAGLPFYLFVVVQTDKKKLSKKTSNDSDDKKLVGLELAKLAIKTCFKPYNFVFLFSVFLQGTSHVIMYNFLFFYI